MSDLATELDVYEVSQSPAMAGSRLDWMPWVDRAVTQYEVTRLPHVTVHGLWDALRRAEIERGDAHDAVVLDLRTFAASRSLLAATS
jgi:hypothetical protein